MLQSIRTAPMSLVLATQLHVKFPAMSIIKRCSYSVQYRSNSASNATTD